MADKEGFAHPPFSSYLYALSLWLSRGSLAGPEMVHALAFAGLLFFAYRLLAGVDRLAACAAVLLLAASPAMQAYYGLQESEPLMTTCGLAGLYCCLRRTSLLWPFLGGLCLGFAFALKLWLCAPLVLAAATAIVFRSAPLREKLVALALCVLGGLIPSALHLLAIAFWYPQDLGFWLREIYFGIFMSAGISGSKLSGSGTPTEWMHPVWYYAAALYRDHFFLLPIVLFGGRSLWRDNRLRGPLLLVLAAGMSGLLPLSLMKVKEPLYILACTVFIYLLAGCCLAAMINRIRTTGALDSVSLKLGGAITLGLMLLFPLAYLRHIQPDKITSTFVLLHTVTLTAILAAVLVSHWKRKPALLQSALYAACALAVIGTFAHTWLTQRGRDAAIARAVMPYLENNPPNALSFIASNFKGYQYYTYHRGCYWRELPLDAEPATLLDSAPFASVRVFIVEALDQRKPELAPWLRWLEAHTTEKTGNFTRPEESSPGVRVFVRGP
jgi:hypothetical protein